MPIEKVGRSGFPRIRIDRTLPLPPDDAGDAEGAHETFDRAVGDVVSVATRP